MQQRYHNYTEKHNIKLYWKYTDYSASDAELRCTYVCTRVHPGRVRMRDVLTTPLIKFRLLLAIANTEDFRSVDLDTIIPFRNHALHIIARAHTVVSSNFATALSNRR